MRDITVTWLAPTLPLYICLQFWIRIFFPPECLQLMNNINKVTLTESVKIYYRPILVIKKNSFLNDHQGWYHKQINQNQSKPASHQCAWPCYSYLIILLHSPLIYPLHIVCLHLVIVFGQIVLNYLNFNVCMDNIG